MDRYRDRSVMDRNRDTQRRDETRSYGRGRDDERAFGEGFDREGYLREGREDWQSRDRWQSRDPEWERDRYGRGGGYGQGAPDYRGEDRWRPGDGNRGWTTSQFDAERGREREFGRDAWDRGSRGVERPHSGTYRGYGSVSPSFSWQGRDAQEPLSRDRDRDWNEDTRDQRESPGIMESIGRFFGFGPKNYRRSDERIMEEVNDRLYRHPDIDASDIVVLVTEAEVTLSGTVDNRRAKYLAEDLCDHVMGVKEVNNQLRVRKHETAGTSYRGMGMGGSSLGTPDEGTGSK